MGDKGLLNRMKSAALCHPLDRKDVSAVMTDRKRKARVDASSIDNDCAGATLAAVTALLGPGQMQPFAKKIQKRDARVIKWDGSGDTVYGESR